MTTLTREKIEALREAARVANSDTDYIPPVMMRCDPDTILSLCDMAEAGQTDRVVLGEDDRQWFRDYLAEGMHTAFRKGSDHPAAGTAWRAIGDLPQAEWSMIVEFVASAMIDGLEHRLSRAALSKAQEDGE